MIPRRRRSRVPVKSIDMFPILTPGRSQVCAESLRNLELHLQERAELMLTIMLVGPDCECSPLNPLIPARHAYALTYLCLHQVECVPIAIAEPSFDRATKEPEK